MYDEPYKLTQITQKLSSFSSCSAQQQQLSYFDTSQKL